MKKKRVSVGYEDFKRVIDEDIFYVDKSMFIYDLVKHHGMTNLITRPRRFGKTLNFSMLRYFFDITEKDNAYLFDDLKISDYYDELETYRNTHPVVLLSLKCAKQGDYKLALHGICNEIRGQYDKYRFVLNSSGVSDEYKEKYRRILSYNDDNEELFNDSIKFLCMCLKQYYGTNTIILIDEYDVPLEDAYFSGYYDKMVRFIRSLFESALKTNDTLEFAVITGCLRISKESIFTGLNNLQIYSILSKRYSEYFGFTQQEVDGILKYHDLEEKEDIAKQWYDGYLFGDKEIYNPWSIMNYIQDLLVDENAYPAAAWVNTSSNSIIKHLVERSDAEQKRLMEGLMNGYAVETVLAETVTYGDLEECAENIWSFLLFTGYLKVQSMRNDAGENYYSLVIPNAEIKMCYQKIIMNYFNKFVKQVNKDDLYTALLNRDCEAFQKRITELLQKSISFYDNHENFYHGLLAGLLMDNPYYRVVSNHESGDGRSDIILYQEDNTENAIILELKRCKAEDNMRLKCREALEQIDRMNYAGEAQALGYKNIIKYGIAFKKKLCVASVE